MNWTLQHLHTASVLIQRAKRNLQIIRDRPIEEHKKNIHERISILLDLDNAEDCLKKAEALL